MKQTTITMDGCGRIAVPSDAANVWMNEMELVRLFGVIAPTLRAAIRAVYKSGVLKPCEVCPTAIMRMYMPCRWSWHSLSVSTHPMLQGCAMPCWKGCAYEKTDKCCGLHWAAVTNTGVRLTTVNITIVFC